MTRTNDLAPVLTFGSLFSGIGGLDLGLERAGMRCAWQVEIDDYASRVLAKHWPDVPRYRDVRECGAHNLGPVDLVCGGFPCQPHSVSGKRRGAADDRNLWPEMRRIVSELQPTWVLAENVDNIVNTYLDVVLADLEAEGYEARTVVFPALSIGAPHIRQRAWIVAYAESVGQHGRRLPARPRRPQQATADASRHGAAVPHANGNLLEESGKFPAGQRPPEGGRWTAEPGVCRVAHGIPRRVDRLRGLGNAVVPQVAEFIGRLIMEAAS